MKIADRKIKDPVNSFQVNPALEDIRKTIRSIPVFQGIGSPESVVSARIGSLFLRQDGGASTTFYVKESDDGGLTGWVAK